MIALADGITMAGYDDASTGHDWQNNFFFLRMEEKTGVHFELTQYVESDVWDKTRAAWMAGKETMPEVLFKAALNVHETLAMSESGLLVDLKPYIATCMPNLSALLAAHPEWEQAITLPSGAIAALPTISELQNNNAIWINTQWLERLNLQMPTNAEELLKVLRAFKVGDPNRNGKADEVPLTFTGMWDLRFLGHAFGMVTDDYYLTNEGGTVHEMVTSDNNRAFLTWLNTIWSEGLMDRYGFVSSDTSRAITETDATIFYGVVFGPSMMSMVPSSALEHYAALMPMEYEGAQRYRLLLNDVIRGSFAVTKECRDVETVLRWVDFLYSEEGMFLAGCGVEGEEYEIHSDGTWAWLDSLQYVTDTVMKEYTITDGSPTPGYVTADYQLNFDDEATHKAVVQLAELRRKAVSPMPLVTLGKEQSEKLSAIWPKLGAYAETQMARFVTGDVEMNDQNWNEFVSTVKQLGMDEVVSIFEAAK